MTECFIIPPDEVANLRIKLDEFNSIEPILIEEGTDAGSFYLDTNILVRVPSLDSKLGSGKPAKIKIKDIDVEKTKKEK